MICFQTKREAKNLTNVSVVRVSEEKSLKLSSDLNMNSIKCTQKLIHVLFFDSSED